MAHPERGRRYGGIYYVFVSFDLWALVEYLTVWHSKLGEWVALMPWVLIQYLVIALIFSYFIFRRGWSERRLFFLMLGVMYVLEFLWANPLLLNPLTFVPASLLLTSMWSFLTFVPLWLVRGEVRRHRGRTALCLLWIPVGFVAAIILG